MHDVARRAGVGAGTVHRHFPTKDALVEAVLVAHTGELIALAHHRSTDADAGRALFGVLGQVVEHVARHRHLCGAFTADRSGPRTGIAEASRRFDEALDVLLGTARDHGAVRPEVTLADVHTVVLGAGAMLATGAHARPLVDRVLGTLAPDDVTKSSVFRDDTAAPSRCEECGAPLSSAPVGRPARFCGARCRQRARRRRVSS